MASIWDWQTSSNVIRISNKNYIGDAITHFYNNWISYKACVPAEYQHLINVYKPIDNTVRIPASSVYNGNYLTNADFDSGGSPEYKGQYILGDYANPPTSEVLDFIPRLYVELTSLKDFTSNVLTPRGETQIYSLDFMFNEYGNPLVGYNYTPVQNAHLNPIYYVLTYVGIYTNKTDGSQQTLLAEYTPDKITSPCYDMFTPFNPVGHDWSGRGYQCAVPYMFNFIPRRYTGRDKMYSGPKYIGNAGGLGISNNIGIQYYVSLQPGEISSNPFLPVVNIAMTKSPQLTAYPGGNGTNFPVASIDDWKKIFFGSGMAWSFNRNDVIAPDDSNLNKPTFPGQPDNPTGGGGGDGDNISDEIPLPDVKFFPNNNSYNRYWLTPAQLPELQNWIFNKTFFDNILRLWNDPAEYLINLTFYPFNGYLHDVTNVNTTATLSIGNLSSDITCIAMLDGYNPVFQGGTYTVNEYYGTYLDYAPYTTAEIYIPYIGYRNLNINDIMGKTLSLRYVVDWDTNIITATILVNDTPLTMYSGSFGVKLALSGTNANQLAETITQGAISTVVSMAGVVGSAAGTVATGATGNIPGAIQGAAQTSQSIGGAVGGVVDTVMNTQVHPRYYGQPTPATGLYNTQIPHIIFHRPITAEPLDYRALHGYTAGYSGKVSEFSGYLQCKEIQLGANTTISAAEQTEIINLMKGGIFA